MVLPQPSPQAIKFLGGTLESMKFEFSSLRFFILNLNK